MIGSLRDIKKPVINLPIFTTEQTERLEREKELRERFREDYKFYQKCLRVLSKKKGKEKLIIYIRKEMEIIEHAYHWPELHRYV